MTTFRKGRIFVFPPSLTVYVKWVYYGLTYCKILELVNLVSMDICTENLIRRGVKVLKFKNFKV